MHFLIYSCDRLFSKAHYFKICYFDDTTSAFFQIHITAIGYNDDTTHAFCQVQITAD